MADQLWYSFNLIIQNQGDTIKTKCGIILNFYNQLFILLLTLSISTLNAKGKTRNVIFITFDGLRWEEVFYGADSSLIYNDNFTKERKHMVEDYWADTPKTRREKLMPFFWSTIKTKGQLYGNVGKGSVVTIANPCRCS